MEESSKNQELEIAVGKMGSYTECGWEPRGADVPQGEMPDSEQGEEGAGAGGAPGRAGGAARR